MLPELNDRGMLDPADEPYPATLSDLESVFVNGAPFESRRRLILRAIHLDTDLVWDIYPDARMWVNGGFTTLKPWAAPEDADIVVIVPIPDFAGTTKEHMFPLQTMLNAHCDQPGGMARKVHPFGGLLDAFFEPDHPSHLPVWHHHQWSSVKGPDGKIIEGQLKGYV